MQTRLDDLAVSVCDALRKIAMQHERYDQAKKNNALGILEAEKMHTMEKLYQQIYHHWLHYGKPYSVSIPTSDKEITLTFTTAQEKAKILGATPKPNWILLCSLLEHDTRLLTLMPIEVMRHVLDYGKVSNSTLRIISDLQAKKHPQAEQLFSSVVANLFAKACMLSEEITVQLIVDGHTIVTGCTDNKINIPIPDKHENELQMLLYELGFVKSFEITEKFGLQLKMAEVAQRLLEGHLTNNTYMIIGVSMIDSDGNMNSEEWTRFFDGGNIEWLNCAPSILEPGVFGVGGRWTFATRVFLSPLYDEAVRLTTNPDFCKLYTNLSSGDTAKIYQHLGVMAPVTRDVLSRYKKKQLPYTMPDIVVEPFQLCFQSLQQDTVISNIAPDGFTTLQAVQLFFLNPYPFVTQRTWIHGTPFY